MEKDKSSSQSRGTNDVDLSELDCYKQLFDCLGITKKLGSVQIINKNDGSGETIRFGFFH